MLTGALSKLTIKDKIALPPGRAPVLYRLQFKKRRAAYRKRFTRQHGRPVDALSEEDYSPVRFFIDVWGEIVERTIVTPGYLERLDRPCYYALLNWMRGADVGKRGRSRLTWEDLGVATEQQILDLLLRKN